MCDIRDESRHLVALACQSSAIQQDLFVLTNEVKMRRPGSTAG
jgi:hypothetical protein